MMKILPIPLLIISSNAFAQSYSEQIAMHGDHYKRDFVKDSRVSK